MKIQRKITFLGREYQYLSDHDKEVDDLTLFVRTPRNAAFAMKDCAMIDFKQLVSYFKLPPKIIGITGTNGKTTIANLIAYGLNQWGIKTGVIGTQGVFLDQQRLKPKGLTTPGFLELYDDLETLALQGAEAVVMEVSSHALHQVRIHGIPFFAKILSNITRDHLDYHKTFKEYARVKNSFFQDAGLKIINLDEKKAQFNPSNTLTYSLKKPANLCALKKDFTHNIKAEVHFCLPLLDGDQSKEDYRLDSRLFGKHNLYNLLAATLGVYALLKSSLIQVRKEEILEILGGFRGVEGRLEVVSEKPLVIVDFAHTPDGMEQIFKSFKGREMVVVFGAGGDRDRSKRPLMGAIAEKYAKKIFLTSDNPRSESPRSIILDILAGMKKLENIHVQEDRRKAIESALAFIQERPDAVLLILGKGDETYQIIGDQRLDFDDRKIVREILESKRF